MKKKEDIRMSEKTEAIHDLLIEIIYTSKTIEEAKARVKEEQEQLEEQNRVRVEETLKKSKEINDRYVK